MKILLVCMLSLCGCSSNEGETTWGRATGWFAQFNPADVRCALVGGQSDTELWVSFTVGKSDARLILPNIAKNERAQRQTELKYGLNGQATLGAGRHGPRRHHRGPSAER
jgi:hypothetical protein